jgi:hypothetical protein
MAHEALKKTTICSHWQASGVCPFGEKCSFAHGTNELRAKPVQPPQQVNGGYAPVRAAYRPPQAPQFYAPRPAVSYESPYAPAASIPSFRPELRKTKMCRNFEQTGTCQFGDGCNYAHSAAELQTLPPRAPQSYAPYSPPVTYSAPPAAAVEPVRGTRPELHKTKMCRNVEQTGTCQFGDRCSYAHSAEELNQLPPRNAYAPAPYVTPVYQSTRYQPAPALKRSLEPSYAAGASPSAKRIRPDLYKTTICAHFASSNTCPFGDNCVYAHGEEELRPRNASEVAVPQE